MTKWDFSLTDSLTKILPDSRPRRLATETLYGFAGETLSFQLAYFCENSDFGESDSRFTVQVEFDLPNAVQMRKVQLVPCAYPCHGTWDENYLVTKPGLYPDLLTPFEPGQPIKAIPAQWRGLWIDVQVGQISAAGLHELLITANAMDGIELARFRLAVRIFPVKLPPQRLIHTEWFHADCLADYYHVPVFSEAHWRIIENFMKSAARHGVNMILTPIFTPPLDTAKGGERTTVQLVKVKKEGEKYFFDFSDLARWIALSERAGIRYLEMAHLFTQWGATAAPKIMGSVDGGPEEMLFGWHTPAVGSEYTRFLHSFLPALKAFLSEQGWLERTWFHISDEPHDCEINTFAHAKESVRELLEGCKVMDALSSHAIYKQGLVERPVVSVDHIAPFLKERVPHLWAYYCTVQAVDVPNRFIAMSSPRNRIIGILLYYFGIEGFLHWGFNFYNSQRSVEHVDPYHITDAGEAFPSGDPFLVYPGPDGTAYDSIRGMVLRQALSDFRCLQLLEERQGAEKAQELVRMLTGAGFSFQNYPQSVEFFSEFRSKVFQALGLLPIEE